jgi:hypothetical protein
VGGSADARLWKLADEALVELKYRSSISWLAATTLPAVYGAIPAQVACIWVMRSTPGLSVSRETSRTIAGARAIAVVADERMEAATRPL